MSSDNMGAGYFGTRLEIANHLDNYLQFGNHGHNTYHIHVQPSAVLLLALT